MRQRDPDFKRIINRSPLNKETKQVLLDLVDQGVRMRRTKDGLVIYADDGVTTIGTHFTPTNPRRTHQNLVADLRRAGLLNKEK